MTALGSAVVWTRLLTQILGGTTYTFSLIRAAFLTGLGIGSCAGSALAKSVASPRTALATCQLLVMIAIGWAAYSLCIALPNWPVNPALAPSVMAGFQVDLVRALWVVLPAAILWGMSFPLALAAVASEGQDPGRLVGTVYAANTVGCIAGALLAGLSFIAALGTQGTQRVLIGVAAAAAVLMFLFDGSPETHTPQRWPGATRHRALLVPATIMLAAVLAACVPEVPPLLVAYGRFAVSMSRTPQDFLYVGEGLNASLAVSRAPDGGLNYHNSGKVQASNLPQDMRLQRMLGHLTTLVPEHPSRVLVIGCGAGVTAGAVSIDPLVERVVIAEIEPLVPRVVSTYFSAHNEDVVRNPKVDVRIDDARHYLLTSRETFDAITSDPLDPWVKGAATLYTKEFFEVMRDHVNPGGVVTVFVQLYESGMQAVKSEIATVLEVVPDGVVFGNTHEGGGYDVVLVGLVGTSTIDVGRIERRLADPRSARVSQSLSEIGFSSGVDLLATFAAQGPQLASWLADAQINRDRNLRLQYLAGLGLNRFEQALIYSQIIANRRMPPGLFTGPAARLQALHAGILSR
ncbi:MAG: spermidine synthase [Planctomycetia bacterium]